MINKRQLMLLAVCTIFSAHLVSAADENIVEPKAMMQLKMLQQRMEAAQSGAASDAKASTLKKTKTTPAGKEVTTTSATRNVTSYQPGGVKQTRAKTSVDEDAYSLEVQQGIQDEAYEQLEKKLFPLSPEQTMRLHQQHNVNEFAITAPVGTPPRPTATSQMVNLSPGATPPVVRLAQGFVSSVVFLDSTGAPWPIVSYDLGDPASFNIQWDQKSNTLMIQSMKLYNYGNMAIRLAGLNTPVMLTLVPGQKAVDYRVDMRVRGYGPNAKSLPTGEGLPAGANNSLLNVLDGVPPAGSRRLTVEGGPAKAWLVGNKLFVRTHLTILSPGWIASMTSADGTHAYEMQKAPVLLVSWHGKMMQLKLEGL